MTSFSNQEEYEFLKTESPKIPIILNVVLAVAYFWLLLFWFERGNAILFGILMFGEVFHIWQALTFLYTVWDTEGVTPTDESYRPEVDVFITVAGEPVDIVQRTVIAALEMNYPNFSVYVLNDGFVAKKSNWYDIKVAVEELGARCITRSIAGGAKAGNINHGLGKTQSPFVAVFDADHIPHPDFLKKTMGYFADSQVGFVQTPQYYKNHALNMVTEGSWNQQELWFGALCKGKNRLNGVSMCGTNMVIRRSALEKVGGMCTESIAEDFITGALIHSRGWKSVYVPEVLAKGLAPEDFLSYYKQQFRWARGALDLIFRYNIFFRRGLTLAQRIQYLSSASYFFSGIIVVLNASLPLIYFLTGEVPLQISTMALAAVFLPYMFLMLYILKQVSNSTFTFRSLAFSMAAFNIHIKAFFLAALGVKSSFSVTPKRAVSGNFWYLVLPQFFYILLFVASVPVAFVREGLTASFITNFSWALLNAIVFGEFIRAALPEGNRMILRKPAESVEALAVSS